MSEASGWSEENVTNLARKAVSAWDFQLHVSSTNALFGLNYTYDIEDEASIVQILYIAVIDRATADSRFFSSGSPKDWVIAYNEPIRGNMSIAAYEVRLEKVFVTDCHLYNTTFDLNISVANRQSTMHVVSALDVHELDMDQWLRGAYDVGLATTEQGFHSRMSPGSADSYTAMLSWLELMHSKVLGFEANRRSYGTFMLANEFDVFNQSKEYWNVADYKGDDSRMNASPRIPLGDLIETLSTNFSLSLLSDESLWYVYA